MSSRAERRRSDRELKRLGLHRRFTVLTIGDTASDVELLRLARTHESELKNPSLSADVRHELERSLAGVRAVQQVLAQLDPARPATAAKAN